MTFLTADTVKAQIQRLLSDCPDLREDDEALCLSLESETDATVLCERLVQGVQQVDDWLETLKQSKKRIDERAKRLKFRQEKLEHLIIEILQAAGRKSLPLPSGTPIVAPHRHVVVTNYDLVPDYYRRQLTWKPYPDSEPDKKLTWEPDKKLIGARIKAGEAVPGCELSNAEASLTIRTK